MRFGEQLAIFDTHHKKIFHIFEFIFYISW